MEDAVRVCGLIRMTLILLYGVQLICNKEMRNEKLGSKLTRILFK